jgi:hypothetical protein
MYCSPLRVVFLRDDDDDDDDEILALELPCSARRL